MKKIIALILCVIILSGMTISAAAAGVTPYCHVQNFNEYVDESLYIYATMFVDSFAGDLVIDMPIYDSETGTTEIQEDCRVCVILTDSSFDPYTEDWPKIEIDMHEIGVGKVLEYDYVASEYAYDGESFSEGTGVDALGESWPDGGELAFTGTGLYDGWVIFVFTDEHVDIDSIYEVTDEEISALGIGYDYVLVLDSAAREYFLENGGLSETDTFE